MSSFLFSKIYSPKSNVSNTLDLSGYVDAEQELLETLSFINDRYFETMKESIQYQNKITYENMDYVEEGFGDFLKGMGKFFMDILKKIGEFFRKTFSYIASYIGDFDKFLANNEKFINTLEPAFNVNCFKYTIDENVPDTTEIFKVIDKYNSDVKDLENISMDTLLKDRNEWLSENYLMSLRAKVLGTNGRISKEEFLEEVQASFRNGDHSSKPPLEFISSKELKEAVDNYKKLKEVFKKTVPEKAKIEKILGNMKSFFSTTPTILFQDNNRVYQKHTISSDDRGISFNKTDTGAYDRDTYKKVTLFYKYKFEQAKELSVIITNVYFEKMKAINEAIKTYQHIIRKALMKKDPNALDVESKEKENKGGENNND